MNDCKSELLKTMPQVRIIRDMTPQPICLELLEVGGAAKYSKYREFFFSFDIDAVFLVYDVSNKRQRRGVVQWENMIHEKLGEDMSSAVLAWNGLRLCVKKCRVNHGYVLSLHTWAQDEMFQC